MIILKIFVLQLFWLLVVLFGASLNSLLLIGGAIFLATLSYYFYNPKISKGRFFLSLFCLL